MRFGTILRNTGVSLAAALVWLVLTLSAHALEPISVKPEATAIDLTDAIELVPNVNGQATITTAANADGIVRKVEIKAREGGTATQWVVFALTNTSDEQIDRMIVAPYYRLVGSGIFGPDLDKQRISFITPSQGFAPERISNPSADIFTVTLDPGATVTFIGEVRSETIPQIYLWEPDAYRDHLNRLTMFYGIVIGIAGVAAIFLSILFIVRGGVVFPASAGFAWAVLLFLCVDFGFWQKAIGLFNVPIPTARAICEMMLTLTFLLFVGVYMNINRWKLPIRYLLLGVLGFFLFMVGLSFLVPSFVAGIARISMGLSCLAITGGIIYLAFHHHDRSIHILPMWIVAMAWMVGSAFAAMGIVSNDLVAAALDGGLVLVVLLLSFTVLQHAVASGALGVEQLSDLERNALAMAGAGAILWDWNVLQDHISTGKEAEQALNLQPGALQGAAIRWLSLLHPGDRDKFRTALDAAVEHGRGRIEQVIRLRKNDGQYSWFSLRARPVMGADGEIYRCIGTLADVTDQKIAEERLMQDAIHDNLTGLPNRELFLDRIDVALSRLEVMPNVKPTVYLIDVDQFKSVNDRAGMSVGDAALLTLSRRLTRLLKADDTLGRLASDEFGLLLLSEQSPEKIAEFTERLRETIRTPIAFGGQELLLTASIGITAYDGSYRRGLDMLKDAEIAMYHAKRFGTDRAETFKPSLRGTGADRLSLEGDLRRALQTGELQLLYQPIIALENNALAGFSTVLRWNHPRLGLLAPDDFMQVAEETGMAVELGLHVMRTSVNNCMEWLAMSGKTSPLFVTVNVGSRHMFRSDLINDVKTIVLKTRIPPQALKFAIPEALVMDSPEYATMMLTRLKEVGVGLILDEFGTGYSNLAYLQRFPFDTMRIGRSLLRASAGKQQGSLLRAVMNIAHGLNMKPLAEGIDHASDGAKLLKIGCVYAQGSSFGEPMTAEQVMRTYFVKR